MTKAKLHRMASGHIVATFKTDGVVTGTRVIGSPSDTFDQAAKHAVKNFNVDLVLIDPATRKA